MHAAAGCQPATLRPATHRPVHPTSLPAGAAWSPDETRVAYVAEAPPATKTPEWCGAPAGPDGKKAEGAAAPKGWRGQSEWSPDWGENFTGEPAGQGVVGAVLSSLWLLWVTGARTLMASVFVGWGLEGSVQPSLQHAAVVQSSQLAGKEVQTGRVSQSSCPACLPCMLHPIPCHPFAISPPAGKKPPTLFVLDCQSGSVQHVAGLPEDSSCGQPVWAPDGG